MTVCIDVVGYQRFGGSCCLHLQGGPPKRWYPTTTLHGIVTTRRPQFEFGEHGTWDKTAIYICVINCQMNNVNIMPSIQNYDQRSEVIVVQYFYRNSV
jgi:hypothetical protein